MSTHGGVKEEKIVESKALVQLSRRSSGKDPFRSWTKEEDEQLRKFLAKSKAYACAELDKFIPRPCSERKRLLSRWKAITRKQARKIFGRSKVSEKINKQVSVTQPYLKEKTQTSKANNVPSSKKRYSMGYSAWNDIVNESGETGRNSTAASSRELHHTNLHGLPHTALLPHLPPPSSSSSSFSSSVSNTSSSSTLPLTTTTQVEKGGISGGDDNNNNMANKEEKEGNKGNNIDEEVNYGEGDDTDEPCNTSSSSRKRKLRKLVGNVHSDKKEREEREEEGEHPKGKQQDRMGASRLRTTMAADDELIVSTVCLPPVDVPRRSPGSMTSSSSLIPSDPLTVTTATPSPPSPPPSPPPSLRVAPIGKRTVTIIDHHRPQVCIPLAMPKPPSPLPLPYPAHLSVAQHEEVLASLPDDLALQYVAHCLLIPPELTLDQLYRRGEHQDFYAFVRSLPRMLQAYQARHQATSVKKEEKKEGVSTPTRRR